jgi:molybdate transport system substrate-binding protein
VSQSVQVPLARTSAPPQQSRQPLSQREEYLAKLFASWDADGGLKDRITVAPPGVPVGSLVARGDIELAFQQLSELGGEGIEVLGPLPPEIQMITTFSGGVALSSAQPDAARELLAFLGSPALRGLKQAHGMDAA